MHGQYSASKGQCGVTCQVTSQAGWQWPGDWTIDILVVPAGSGTTKSADRAWSELDQSWTACCIWWTKWFQWSRTQ